MDISPKQVQEIQEIEKQVDTTNGPKILTEHQEKNNSMIKNILAAAGIAVGATLGIVILVMVPFGKKQVVPQPQVTTSQVAVSPNITVTTEYVNPFSPTAQYSNPFTASQNPFTQFTQ